jgi:DNA-binding FadR family transcriptional regulator
VTSHRRVLDAIVAGNARKATEATRSLLAVAREQESRPAARSRQSAAAARRTGADGGPAPS